MISFTQLSHKLSTTPRKRWIWIGLVLAALPVLRIYYVQEMLAALILVSLLSIVVSAAALAIFLLVRAVKPIILWVTPNAGLVVRKGIDAVKAVIANPVWVRVVPRRVRREKLKGNEKKRIVYLRSMALRPNRAYRAGLQAGVAARMIGLSVRKRVSDRLGPWLRERVPFRRLVTLPSRGHLFVRIRGIAFAHSTINIVTHFPERRSLRC